MKKLKLASLLVLVGCGAAFACNGSDDSGDADGVGASNTGGGATGGAGGANSNTGGTPMGGDGNGTPAGCDSVTKATGTPAMIDDFEGSTEPGFILENDGRAGQWAHGHFLNPAGALPEFDQDGMGGAGNGYMRISCESGNTDDFPQCNTDWDMAKPWEQWASVSTLLQTYSDPLSCYDVDGVFTGIRFKARSRNPEGDYVRIQITTPDADPDTGETYQKDGIYIEYVAPGSTDWPAEPKEVPFSQIEQPPWSTISAPLNLKAIQSIAIVVRTRTDQEDDGMVIGEKLEPYNIEIDDVEFY